jgi:hypothetical protein
LIFYQTADGRSCWELSLNRQPSAQRVSLIFGDAEVWFSRDFGLGRIISGSVFRKLAERLRADPGDEVVARDAWMARELSCATVH